jgi:predicted patatin/cPLA2 family phospholipase
MHYEGGKDNLGIVKEQMYTYSKYGKGCSFRPLLLVLGGGQRGVYSGGGVIALTKLGLINAFETMIGISTGAPVISYFASGQATLGTSIYFEDNTKGEFINFKKLFKWESIMNLDWLTDVFDGITSNKKLNINKLRKHPTDLYYAVSDIISNKTSFLDPKELDNPTLGIKASCAMPIAYGHSVKINNHYYVDGGLIHPLPSELIIKKFNPTSILIFANRSNSLADTILHKVIYHITGLFKGKKMKNDLILNDTRFENGLETLRKSKLPFIIIWTDNRIGTMTTNPRLLKSAATRFEKYVIKLFKK